MALARRLAARRSLGIAAWGVLTVLVVWSAILAKTMNRAPFLADVLVVPVRGEPAHVPSGNPSELREAAPSPAPTSQPTPTSQRIQATPTTADEGQPTDLSIRWFDGRPVKPAREIWMTVTAYSPDSRSCGDSADGITATLHHVTTNGFKLVAADPRVLPYGSMISIPGYDITPGDVGSEIVPVLDCGGAIKGYRLDVIFPTHEQARAWGVRRLKVTVWDFVDGSPRVNPRHER